MPTIPTEEGIASASPAPREKLEGMLHSIAIVDRGAVANTQLHLCQLRSKARIWWVALGTDSTVLRS